MAGWAPAAAVLGLALAAAAMALRTPTPRPIDAQARDFSAERAKTDVRAIAAAPHPAGSAAQLRVRAYLVGRMTALGLGPQVRPLAVDPSGLANIIGVLPGADPNLPAVLFMAHYDSVRAGPGAADDGAGVAAVLETVRAIKASGRPKRTVMALLTDGEETGLLGAKAFFSAPPERDSVGIVINLEARGDRGRAVMFETRRQAGPLIAWLIENHALQGASSLMPDLYRRLPNDTDLTEALRAGHDGLNFAFFAGLEAYHRPSDTPERLDPGSLQSIGNQALAAARALANAPALPDRGPDLVYADLLGGPILAYPVAAGWALLALAGAGLAFAILRQKRVDLWRGALIAALAIAGVLQAAAPLDTPLWAWPVVLGCVGAALEAVSRNIWAVLPFSFAAAAQTLYGAGLMFALVGKSAPLALTPFAALVLLALLPLVPGRHGPKSDQP